MYSQQTLPKTGTMSGLLTVLFLAENPNHISVPIPSNLERLLPVEEFPGDITCFHTWPSRENAKGWFFHSPLNALSVDEVLWTANNDRN